MDIVKGTFLFYTQLNSVGWTNTQNRLFQVSKDGQERDYLALVQPSFVMVLIQMEKKQQQPYYLYLNCVYALNNIVSTLFRFICIGIFHEITYINHSHVKKQKMATEN